MTTQQHPTAPRAQHPKLDLPYYWHNYTTGQYDELVGLPAPDQIINYIPKVPGARELYDLYVTHQGREPIDAMVEVLERVAGVKK